MTEKILIGKISGVSGIRGEIKLFHFSGERERIAGIKVLYLHFSDGKVPGTAYGAEAAGTVSDGNFFRYDVTSMHYNGKIPIIKLDGIDSRDAAEQMIGCEVFAEPESLVPLSEGSYYISDLIGMHVIGADSSEIGTVKDVISNPAHDILVIAHNLDGEKSEVLLPLVDIFIVSIDAEKRIITVNLPEGINE